MTRSSAGFDRTTPGQGRLDILATFFSTRIGGRQPCEPLARPTHARAPVDFSRWPLPNDGMVIREARADQADGGGVARR